MVDELADHAAAAGYEVKREVQICNWGYADLILLDRQTPNPDIWLVEAKLSLAARTPYRLALMQTAAYAALLPVDVRSFLVAGELLVEPYGYPETLMGVLPLTMDEMCTHLRWSPARETVRTTYEVTSAAPLGRVV